MQLIVITGPSGVGKSSTARAIKKMNLDAIAFPISITTRKKRDNEKEGVDYYYVSEEKFDNMLTNNEILEWTIFDNHRYGTDKKNFETLLSKKKLVILEIDLRGSDFFSKHYANITRICLLPPDKESLFHRLKKRGDNSSESILRRVSDYNENSPSIIDCEIKLINTDLKHTVDTILSILKEKIEKK